MHKTIDEIITTYKRLVYGTALSRTRSKADADDVFQEVFMVCFRKAPAFVSEEHCKAWLIRTTLNLSKKVTHGSWRRKALPLDAAPEQSYEFSTPEENAVHQALRELPEKYGAVLYLFYFEGYSTEEIGSITGTSTGNVRVRMNRARAMMREKLKGEYFYE
jgi:RNA polymerase sigma-70 factor (ECF subfamily)